MTEDQIDRITRVFDRATRLSLTWEAECMADDPFAGDFGSGEKPLSDVMVTTRGGGTCHICGGTCAPRTRNRVLKERDEDGIQTYRFCEPCCKAMAAYGRGRYSILDARHALRAERQNSMVVRTD